MIDSLIEVQKWLYGGMTGGVKSVTDLPGLVAMMSAGFVFGCVHALMPGHGKSVLVSYHLGRPSRLIQGVVTGVLLSATHVGLAAILVLGGVKVISVSLPAAGRAPAMEAISAGLLIAIGIYLGLRALLPHHHSSPRDGRALAIAAGLVPCPLTTFVLTYAIANGRLGIGLAAVLAMLLGIAVTLTCFALAAIASREHLLPILQKAEPMRQRIGFGFDLTSAAMIVAIGLFMLAKLVRV